MWLSKAHAALVQLLHVQAWVNYCNLSSLDDAGILTYETCSNAPWTFFKYNGKLYFDTGIRRLGRDYCIQAWDCKDAQAEECSIRGAPCEWGGAQYNAFFSGDKSC